MEKFYVLIQAYAYQHLKIHRETWCCITGADPGVDIGGGHMASAERESIMGVWRLCPQRGPGAEPLVRGSGGEAPLKLNAFWCCHMSKMALNCYVL